MTYEYEIRPLCEDWIGRGTITLNNEPMYKIFKKGKSILTVPKSKLRRIEEKLGKRVINIEEAKNAYEDYCEIMSAPKIVKTNGDIPQSNFGKQLINNLK